MEDGLAGRGRIEGVSIKGDHRGGLPERGRGRGVGRGGGINAGGEHTLHEYNNNRLYSH